jgi:spermidine synthase
MVFADDTLGRPIALRHLNARALVYLFFFISGMPALIYQLAWQRALFRIFGTSMDSVTVIVTAFMLGLGVGSLAGSWLAQRRPVPALLIVTGIELAIGCFGLSSLALFAHVDPLVQGLTLAGRALTIVALIFVPTALMGATLPLLIDHMVRRLGNVGLSTGILYRINALGAVVGCGLCGLLLFPFLGLQASVLCAAGFNLLVAAIALTAHFADRSEIVRSHAPAAPVPQALLISPLLARFLVLASGFISLSYEIFFLHITSFISGTSALSLTIVLACFLLGIAGGAHTAGEWCEKNTSDLSMEMKRVLLMSALVGAAVLPLIGVAWFLGQGLIALPALGAFLSAQSLAAAFPFVAQLSVPADGSAGRLAGFLYLANIVGSAAGSLLTGFVLFDLFGLRAMAVLLSILSLTLATFLIWNFSPRATRGYVLAPITLVLALCLFQGPLTRHVVDTMLYKDLVHSSSPLTHVIENRYGIVAETADHVVFGGGVYDGRFNVDPVHDSNGILRPLSLSFFHSAPRDVFMIGLATGSWAQVIAANPDVRRLTIVEINPAYIELIRQDPDVRSVLTNPKVRIIIDDATRWLKRHPDMRYDAIMANATYHFRSNATNLLSMEFNRLIEGHLRKGGIYFYNTTDSLRVQLTGCESFRYGYRYTNHMLVSTNPIHFDAVHWRQNLLATQVNGRPLFDLRRVADRKMLDNYMALAASAGRKLPQPDQRPIESCANVISRASAIATVTDDNMGTEWRYPLGMN